jgi:hypothetical protein
MTKIMTLETYPPVGILLKLGAFECIHDNMPGTVKRVEVMSHDAKTWVFTDSDSIVYREGEPLRLFKFEGETVQPRPPQSPEDIYQSFKAELNKAFDNNHLEFTPEKWSRIEICLREAMGVSE